MAAAVVILMMMLPVCDANHRFNLMNSLRLNAPFVRVD